MNIGIKTKRAPVWLSASPLASLAATLPRRAGAASTPRPAAWLAAWLRLALKPAPVWPGATIAHHPTPRAQAAATAAAAAEARRAAALRARARADAYAAGLANGALRERERWAAFLALPGATSRRLLPVTVDLAADATVTIDTAARVLAHLPERERPPGAIRGGIGATVRAGQ